MRKSEDGGIKEYTPELEDLFVSFLMSDSTILTRCLSIVKPKYFDHPPAKKAVSFLLEYVGEHSKVPPVNILNKTCGLSYQLTPPGECVAHEDWFLKEFELFCRHRALEIEILNSRTLLEEKRYGEVEANIKRAVQIGLVKDLGTNPFLDPVAQIEALRIRDAMIPLGWRDIDKRLYGGVEKGTLTIFAGQSGTGKSLFLQNWGINLVQQGLNVMYITLELSEKLTKLRVYAMIGGLSTKDVVKDADDAGTRIAVFTKKHLGTLQIKQLQSHCTANDIRAYVKEYEIQTGVQIDALLIDYLDLLMPYSTKVSPSDLFIKDKYVSEELRNLSIDLNVIVGTASQLNRTSHDEIEFNHSHISGGISKINTADNVIAIFTTATMKENGRYQVQLLKTRSSAGVGSKVDLKYNMQTMRISDMDENDASTEDIIASDIVEHLKQKSLLRPKPENAPKADVISKGTKLRELLKKKT